MSIKVSGGIPSFQEMRSLRVGGGVRCGRVLVAATLALAALTASASAETAEERIKRLEQKLDQALKTIGTLSNEVQALKKKPAASAVPGLEERLTDVEDVVAGIDERVGSRTVVNAFDAVKLDIGGFYDVAATYVHGEDGDAASLNRQTFELLIKAQVAEDWDLFVAQAFRRRSDVVFEDADGRRDPSFDNSSDSPFVLGFANWRYNDTFNVQFGRFLTPHGIINIEHFPAILLDNEQPQFLRPFGGETIFPNFTNGIQFHGSKFFGNDGDQLKYNLYAGNFEGNSDMLNVGGRLAYKLGQSGFTFGGNVTYGRRDDAEDTPYAAFGADVYYDKGPLFWKTEVWLTEEGDTSATTNRFAFYTQPAWRLTDKWTIFNRFDYLDRGTNDGETWENATGITFKPVPNVHLRLNHTFKYFADGTTQGDATTNTVQTNVTVSF